MFDRLFPELPPRPPATPPKQGGEFLAGAISTYRVKQQRECCERLAAVLRSETKQYDLAFPHIYLNQRRLPRYLFRSQGPAGKQDILRIGRISGDDTNVRTACVSGRRAGSRGRAPR